jgi:hypothetical protein
LNAGARKFRIGVSDHGIDAARVRGYELPDFASG